MSRTWRDQLYGLGPYALHDILVKVLQCPCGAAMIGKARQAGEDDEVAFSGYAVLRMTDCEDIKCLCRADMIRKAREAEDKKITELRTQLQMSRKPRHGAKAH